MLAPLLAAVALTAPAGFTESAVLDARAAYIAQKAVHIYCAATDAAWQTFMADNNYVPPDGIAHGITPVVGGDITYIDAQGCATLRKRIAGRVVSLPILGAVLDVLTVESLHLRGERDDGQTACDALTVLPSFLTARWGFHRGTLAWRQVVAGATDYHRRQTAQQYHTGSCG